MPGDEMCTERAVTADSAQLYCTHDVPPSVRAFSPELACSSRVITRCRGHVCRSVYMVKEARSRGLQGDKLYRLLKS